MRTITRHMGRFLSVLLTAAMLVTSVPQSVFTANAAELPGADSTPPPPAITATENADTASSAEPAGETDPGYAEDTAPEGILQEDPAPEDGLSQETLPPESVSEESAPEKEPTEETNPEESTPEENVPAEATPEETPPEDEAPDEAEPGKELPEEAEPEDTIPADTVQEETVSENTLESSPAPNGQETEPLADDRQVYASGTCDHTPSVKWTLYTDGELIVEGTGEIINKEYYGDQSIPWYDYRKDIRSATVRVTGATSAMRMFEDCDKLETVDLKEFDTSEVTDMSFMFRLCRSLKEIDVSTFHTEKVTTMDYMFSGCSSLTKLDLSSFDTSNVYFMGYLADGCSSLKEINVSSFDTSNTRYLWHMFMGCSSLETLDLSSFVIGYDFPGGVVQVDDMVQYCSKLRELKTPKTIHPRVTVTLPYTDGYCSWRTEDGTRVTGFGNSHVGTILSTDGYAGIRFEGAHFTLDGYPDTNIGTFEKVFKKGMANPESFVFTIIPDDGYTATPSVVPKFSSTKITVTPGEEPNQYIVAPKDPAQGYVHDEIITVAVAVPAINPLEIEYSKYTITDYFLVADGKKLADHMTASLSVDNNYDVTLYAKPEVLQDPVKTEYLLPVVDIDTQDVNGSRVTKKIYGEKDADALTDEEKEFSEGGYFVIRLGRFYERAYINLWTEWMYRMTVLTDGFPEGVRLIRYAAYTEITPEGYERTYYEEQACSEDTFIESSKDLLVRPVWDDPSGAHKWCRPQAKARHPAGTEWQPVRTVHPPGYQWRSMEYQYL